MPSIDQDGLAPADARALSSALARDPALAQELDLIMPALDPAARRAFERELARRCGAADRLAAAVLEALVTASRATGRSG